MYIEMRRKILVVTGHLMLTKFHLDVGDHYGLISIALVRCVLSLVRPPEYCLLVATFFI